MHNDESCDVTSIGSIKLRMSNNFVKILGDVGLVLKLKRNLISLGLWDSSGYIYKYENGTLKITTGALIVMKARLVIGLYILEGFVVGDNMTTNFDKIDETLLWYKRLGYISLIGLQHLYGIKD